MNDSASSWDRIVREMAAAQREPMPAVDPDGATRRDEAINLGRQLDELRAGADQKLLEYADALYKDAVVGEETTPAALHKLRMAVQALEARSPDEDQTSVGTETSSLPPAAGEVKVPTDDRTPAAPATLTGGATGVDAASASVPAGVRLVREIAQHCWRGAHWEKAAGQHPAFRREPLKKHHLEEHLNGGKRIGLAPIVPGTDTTRVALLDFDSHKGDYGWGPMVLEARQVTTSLVKRGIEPIPFRSSGGNGIHLLVLWDEPQDAYSVREVLAEALAECGLQNGVKGVKEGEVEIFPKQDAVPPDGAGSMFILPFAGESALLDRETLQPIEVPADFKLQLSQSVEKRERPAAPERVHTEAHPELNELREALSKIYNDAEHSLDYDEWRNVIFGIHDATGGSEEGLALAHEFSARSPKYDAAFLDERVWPYARSREGGITAATIFDMARVADPQSDLAMLDELPETEPEDEAATAQKRFQILDDLEARRSRAPLTWIIKGFLPRAELVVMYGEPGSGKSFAALDIAAAAERGINWRGLRTKKVEVLYVAAEGAPGFLWRLEAYCRANEIERIGMGVIADAPNLHKGPDANALLARIKARGQVDLIVLDTLAAVSPGANENASEDMGRVLQECKRLAHETGATVLLVHHSGKDQTRGSRGWSGIKGAVDAELEVLRDATLRQIRATKQKDGEDGAVFQFKLRVVELGQDEDGDPITSCVLEHLADGSAPELKAGKKGAGRVGGLGAREQIVLRCACDLVELGGESVPMEALIDAVSAQLGHDGAKKDRRRDNTVRAVESLAAKGLFRIDDNEVFITDQGTWRGKALAASGGVQ